jgi:hypothetical protein
MLVWCSHDWQQLQNCPDDQRQESKTGWESPGSVKLERDRTGLVRANGVDDMVDEWLRHSTKVGNVRCLYA